MVVSAAQPPSYGELAALVVKLSARPEQANARISELEGAAGKELLELFQAAVVGRVGQAGAKVAAGKSGRLPGGQAGHRGQTLCQVADPDRSERHEPGRRGGCGAGLADAPEVGAERRQVSDVPPITVAVTEHRLVRRRRGYGAVTTADAPARAGAPVQYGPNAAAIAIYLYAGQFLSRDCTAKALTKLFGTSISAGTVAAMTTRAADAPAARDGFAERVRARLTEAEVAHFDETALRVDRRLRWVHCGSCRPWPTTTATAGAGPSRPPTPRAP